MWLDQLTMLKKACGMTSEEIASASGVPFNTITKIFSGQTADPRLSTIRSIVHSMGYTLDDLDDSRSRVIVPRFSDASLQIARQYDQLDSWGRSAVEAIIREETARCTASAPAAQEEKVITLNFNELKASAGIGWELMDEHMIPWVVKLNDLTRKADFCLEIEGDSMEPKFQDGDLILIRRQPSIEEGQFGLYTFDNRGYVKQQGCGKLHSLNPAYPDIFPGEYADIECKGLVLGKLEPEWIVSR